MTLRSIYSFSVGDHKALRCSGAAFGIHLDIIDAIGKLGDVEVLVGAIGFDRADEHAEGVIDTDFGEVLVSEDVHLAIGGIRHQLALDIAVFGSAPYIVDARSSHD